MQVPTVWLMTKPLKHCSVLQMRSTRLTSRPPSWCPQMTPLQRCCTPWGLPSSSFWQTLPCEPNCCLLYLHVCSYNLDQSQAVVLLALSLLFCHYPLSSPRTQKSQARGVSCPWLTSQGGFSLLCCLYDHQQDHVGSFAIDISIFVHAEYPFCCTTCSQGPTCR